VFSKLNSLLQAQNFKEANLETRKIMLAVANREEEGWLRIEDAEKFPCKELRSIDQLWLKYSSGKFGISVQQQIYQSLGGTKEYNQDVWESMGDHVGWRQGGKWLDYSGLNFTQTAPSGHMPIRGLLVTTLLNEHHYFLQRSLNLVTQTAPSSHLPVRGLTTLLSTLHHKR
jgi:hypothetical protein